MKTIEAHTFGSKLMPAAALAIATSLTAYVQPAAAHDNAGAWAAGGLLAGHMLTRMRMRRREEAVYAGEQIQRQREQAVAPRPAAAAPSATKGLEQKLNELNKLAAGGYITPAEYKAKKKALLSTL